MFDFLTTLLSFFIALGAVASTPSLPEKAVEDNIDNHTAQTSAPNTTPVVLYENAQENKQNQTPPQNNNDSSNQQENKDNSNEPNNNEADKINAYNNKSGVNVGEVAAIAVEKADPLEPCEESQSCHEEPVNENIPTPTITPTIIPIPVPVNYNPPKPPIDPPTGGCYEPYSGKDSSEHIMVCAL